MITRRSRLALLIVPALALATACTGGGDNSGTPAASGDQTLKIGLITQLSGPSKAAGTEAQNGAKLAVDVINGLNPSIRLPLAADAGLLTSAAPGQPGGEGPTPTTEKPKGEEKPSVGVTSVQGQAGEAVTQLVSGDGVNAIIGAYDPEVTEAASQRSERFEVPFVNADSPATFLTDAGRDWFFRSGPTWRSAGQAFFSLLNQEQLAYGRIPGLYAQDKAGQDVLTTTTDLAREGNLPRRSHSAS
jgi:ABC-type branched-subunit amino acid transport system substrate-binding protein